jgi:polyhydroxyalkanoate synthesis regulator phasin
MAFEMEDQRLLAKTISIREKIVDEMLKDGTPTTKENREFFLRTMEGLEHTVLTKSKIKVDEQNSQNQSKTQEMVANLLLRLSTIPSDTRNDTPSLPSSVTLTDMVPGEISTDGNKTTYDEFVAKMS